MTNTSSSRDKSAALLIAGILMIATTLRVTFTGATPLLDAIRADYSLSTAQTGFLTTLPLLTFALVSPLAVAVARRWGIERSLFVAMLLTYVSIAIRSLPSPGFLFSGTAIIGCGIALGNMSLPGLIKRDFAQHVAKLTGAYLLTMGAAAALGSTIVVPLALNGFGWRDALMVLVAFPLLALIIWLPQCRQMASAGLSSSRALHSRATWRSSLAWQVTLFLGINSLIYYVVIGWLPTILISHGYSEAQAGSPHGLLQLAAVAPGLLVPLILNRFKDQHAIAALVSLMYAVGTAGFAMMPDQALLWTILSGFGSGAAMTLDLTFIGLCASSTHQATALSGMAQSVGYLLAACGPPLMGKIHDLNDNWLIPLGGVVVLTMLMAVFGLCAECNREIANA